MEPYHLSHDEEANPSPGDPVHEIKQFAPSASQPWQPPTSRRVGWKGLTAKQLRDLAFQEQRRQASGTMTSIDANILLYSYCEASLHHVKAQAFLTTLSQRDDVALSEFVLSEVYLHLWNPAVLDKPLSPTEAVAVIQSYREHPRWRVIGFPPRSRDIHAALLKGAATPHFDRRRIYDLRTALCLQAFGITEFATANVKDFADTGFTKVWNPL